MNFFPSSIAGFTPDSSDSELEGFIPDLVSYPTIECPVFQPTIILKPHVVFAPPTARIDSFVKIEGGDGVFISDYVHIASFAHLNIGGGRLTLHAGSAVASGARIVTGSNVPGVDRSCSAVAPDIEIKKSAVVVGVNAIIFSGATIMPGVTIGQNAVIAAGAVVTHDVGDYEVWAGVPARKIRDLREPSPGMIVDLNVTHK